MHSVQQVGIDWTETTESEIDVLPGRITCLFYGQHSLGKDQERRDQRDPGDPSSLTGLRKLMAGSLTLIALALPVLGDPPSGTQVLLTWPSLGSGTTYGVQISTDLSNWADAVVTTATSATVDLGKTAASMFRLWASNVPPQSLAVNSNPNGSPAKVAGYSLTLAWNPSEGGTNVAGYYLYYGESTGNYTQQLDAGLSTSVVLDALVPGTTYYFATTAYTALGWESEYSNEIVWPPALALNIQPLP
jgi:hypothetical protein